MRGEYVWVAGEDGGTSSCLLYCSQKNYIAIYNLKGAFQTTKITYAKPEAVEVPPAWTSVPSLLLYEVNAFSEYPCTRSIYYWQRCQARCLLLQHPVLCCANGSKMTRTDVPILLCMRNGSHVAAARANVNFSQCSLCCIR